MSVSLPCKNSRCPSGEIISRLLETYLIPTFFVGKRLLSQSCADQVTSFTNIELFPISVPVNDVHNKHDDSHGVQNGDRFFCTGFSDLF